MRYCRQCQEGCDRPNYLGGDCSICFSFFINCSIANMFVNFVSSIFCKCKLGTYYIKIDSMLQRLNSRNILRNNLGRLVDQLLVATLAVVVVVRGPGLSWSSLPVFQSSNWYQHTPDTRYIDNNRKGSWEQVIQECVTPQNPSQ